MTFTVEIKGIERVDRCEVEIFMDKNALLKLLSDLSHLHQAGDHVHFFSEDWAGSELTTDRQRAGNILVNHLRLTLVAPD